MSNQKKKTVATDQQKQAAQPQAAAAKKSSAQQPKGPAKAVDKSGIKHDPLFQTLPFDRNNYLIILGGILLLVLGYVLLSGEEFVDATEFSVALYVTPPILLAGYVVIALGILKRPKSTNANSTAQA